MPIRNYTTGVQVSTTLVEIGKLLRAHGIRELSERYDEAGKPVAIAFAVETRFGERRYLLPVDPAGVYRVLQRDYQRGKIDRTYRTEAQAERTAWRNLKDWISLQLAMVDTGGMAIEQVMLPYQEIGPGVTVYDAALRSNLDLPSLQPPLKVIALPAPREA